MNSVTHQSIRILIADDHAVVRQGLKHILSKTSDLVVIEEAETGHQVLQKINKTEVDVIVMDMEMPEKTGWDVLLDLKTTHPRLPVLILSIYAEDQLGMRFLEAGASGYLSKTSAPDQLVQAIRRVAQGGKFVSPNLAEQLLLKMGHQGKYAHETLSDREFQIFLMIVSGKALKEIAELLCISTTTVSTHRARILEKLNMNTNAELIRYATREGIM